MNKDLSLFFSALNPMTKSDIEVKVYIVNIWNITWKKIEGLCFVLFAHLFKI